MFVVHADGSPLDNDDAKCVCRSSSVANVHSSPFGLVQKGKTRRERGIERDEEKGRERAGEESVCAIGTEDSMC